LGRVGPSPISGGFVFGVGLAGYSKKSNRMCA
jgi:hypothetical protein